MSTPKRVPMSPTKMWAVVDREGDVWYVRERKEDAEFCRASMIGWKIYPRVQRVLVTAIPTKGRAK